MTSKRQSLKTTCWFFSKTCAVLGTSPTNLDFPGWILMVPVKKCIGLQENGWIQQGTTGGPKKVEPERCFQHHQFLEFSVEVWRRRILGFFEPCSCSNVFGSWNDDPVSLWNHSRVPWDHVDQWVISGSSILEAQKARCSIVISERWWNLPNFFYINLLQVATYCWRRLNTRDWQNLYHKCWFVLRDDSLIDLPII